MILIEYCCRTLFGEKWKEIAQVLDRFILDSAFAEGEDYINSLDITEEKKRKVTNCFLSYQHSC